MSRPNIEEARALASADAVDVMDRVRSRRGNWRAYPVEGIAGSQLFESSFDDRLSQSDNERWPTDVFEAYAKAFVLELAKGNVALVQKPRGDGMPDFYAVDLDIWEPDFPEFRLGEMVTMADPHSGPWKSRSRWRRFRVWFQGR